MQKKKTDFEPQLPPSAKDCGSVHPAASTWEVLLAGRVSEHEAFQRLWQCTPCCLYLGGAACRQVHTLLPLLGRCCLPAGFLSVKHSKDCGSAHPAASTWEVLLAGGVSEQPRKHPAVASQVDCKAKKDGWMILPDVVHE
eukprot:1153726-Pelagomonas_calceolata.AAC.1